MCVKKLLYKIVAMFRGKILPVRCGDFTALTLWLDIAYRGELLTLHSNQ